MFTSKVPLGAPIHRLLRAQQASGCPRPGHCMVGYVLGVHELPAANAPAGEKEVNELPKELTCTRVEQPEQLDGCCGKPDGPKKSERSKQVGHKNEGRVVQLVGPCAAMGDAGN